MTRVPSMPKHTTTEPVAGHANSRAFAQVVGVYRASTDGSNRCGPHPKRDCARPMPSAALLLVAATALAAPIAAPVTPAHVIAGFRAPAGPYAAGHRGIDLAATTGQAVVSPMTGTVAWSGRIAGKDVVTIASGSTVVSLEPVRSHLAAGTPVHVGDPLGAVGRGGHCDARCVHVGVRMDGAYVPAFHGHARLLP